MTTMKEMLMLICYHTPIPTMLKKTSLLILHTYREIEIGAMKDVSSDICFHKVMEYFFPRFENIIAGQQPLLEWQAAQIVQQCTLFRGHH